MAVLIMKGTIIEFRPCAETKLESCPISLPSQTFLSQCVVTAYLQLNVVARFKDPIQQEFGAE